MDLTVDGLVFDLDNTLFDFDRAFAGVARDFYEQRPPRRDVNRHRC